MYPAQDARTPGRLLYRPVFVEQSISQWSYRRFSPPRLPGLANNLGIALNTVLHSQRTPTTYNFNFGVEYELPHQVVVSAGYVGSRGLFLPFGTVDLNQLDLGTIAQYGNSLCITQ